MNTPRYKRLARGHTWTGPCVLWLAEDHMLAAQVVGYAETYKRFFFADIQALVIRKTAGGMIWNGIWGGMALFFALIALQVSDPVGMGILWSITGVFVLLLLVNVIMGPTCDCHIRTAVQSERVRALTRLRSARRVLDRIRPLIAAAQGGLTRDEIAVQLTAAQTSLAPGRDSSPPVMT